MSEPLRQLETGETIRVICEGVPITATVTRHPVNACVYYRSSYGREDYSLRHHVFAVGEEPRLIKRLRDIADDALRSMRHIQEELKEVSHV